MKNFMESKTLKGILIGIGIVVIELAVFRAGMGFGFSRALHAGRWSENYERNFIGARPMMGPGSRDRDFVSGHGAIGTVVRIEGNTIIVRDQDKEHSINVSATTSIRRFRDAVLLKDINAGDRIVVIGSPLSSGAVNADLIRIMPEPLFGASTTTLQR